jgi:hypothetical protein
MSTLKQGDAAPNFSGVDQDGQAVSLSDYSGKKLVLYFYPKDDTPGCTAEASRGLSPCIMRKKPAACSNVFSPKRGTSSSGLRLRTAPC